MHIHFLDPYLPLSSPIHRLDPRVKLVMVITYIFSISLAPPGVWAAYLLYLALIQAAVVLAGIGVGYTLKRAALALPFVLAALPLIFTIPGSTLAHWHLFGVDLSLTQTGLVRFLSIAFKSWVSIQAAILLTATTPFPDFLLALRALHIPRLLVSILGLMWRYLFILADEAIRLLRARTARSGSGAVPGAKIGGSLIWRAKVTGGMAGNLFLRSFERSDRIYMAMLSRGYDGEARNLPLPVLGTSQKITLAAGLSALFLLLVFSLLLSMAGP